MIGRKALLVISTCLFCVSCITSRAHAASDKSSGDFDLKLKLDAVIDGQLTAEQATARIGRILPDQRVSDEGTTWTSALLDGQHAVYSFTYRDIYFILLVERDSFPYEKCLDVRIIPKIDSHYEVAFGGVEMEGKGFLSNVVTIYNFAPTFHRVGDYFEQDDYVSDIAAAFGFDLARGKIENLDVRGMRMSRGQE